MLRQQEVLKGNSGPTAEFLRAIGRKKEKHVKDPKDVGETNHEPFQFCVKKTYEKESWYKHQMIWAIHSIALTWTTAFSLRKGFSH